MESKLIRKKEGGPMTGEGRAHIQSSRVENQYQKTEKPPYQVTTTRT